MKPAYRIVEAAFAMETPTAQWIIKYFEPIAKRWRFEALGGVLRLAGRHFR
jgi:hypothetical protein